MDNANCSREPYPADSILSPYDSSEKVLNDLSEPKCTG